MSGRDDYPTTTETSHDLKMEPLRRARTPPTGPARSMDRATSARTARAAYSFGNFRRCTLITTRRFHHGELLDVDCCNMPEIARFPDLWLGRPGAAAEI